MARDDERLERSQQDPIVGGLPDVPGILAAIRLTPKLGVHLRGLADELLVNDFPGATLQRHEREMLATAVSAANDCFYCMDSHGAFATALLERNGATHLAPVVDVLKTGRSDGLDDKMCALLHIARTVQATPRGLTEFDVAAAQRAGASDADVQLAVLIAAAFSMFNRMVEGFRARTAPSAEAYRARAGEIAEHGYSPPPAASVPGPA
ncbi:MAG TPA: carboxymuconolactone decarboxylase family protein [Candidatus Limnocylindrales bacterium]|nr:carboxymuconolactone decarboxylase family protein [Candidatus Limnocylindrales bacterium]